jgi:hypothetical protein
MSVARVIEIDDLTAGILVPDAPGRFRFFSSNRVFDRLEGRSFRTIREAIRAARDLLVHKAGASGHPAQEMCSVPR